MRQPLAHGEVFVVNTPLPVTLGADWEHWQATHAPAANTQATITIAASAGKRVRLQSLTATLAAGASAPAAWQGWVYVRDGSATGTILWSGAVPDVHPALPGGRSARTGREGRGQRLQPNAFAG